jgi:hypothetical protein
MTEKTNKRFIGDRNTIQVFQDLSTKKVYRVYTYFDDYDSERIDLFELDKEKIKILKEEIKREIDNKSIDLNNLYNLHNEIKKEDL